MGQCGFPVLSLGMMSPDACKMHFLLINGKAFSKPYSPFLDSVVRVLFPEYFEKSCPTFILW